MNVSQWNNSYSGPSSKFSYFNDINEIDLMENIAIYESVRNDKMRHDNASRLNLSIWLYYTTS